MEHQELSNQFRRVGASYRELPTDELLGELKHLQNWARGFMNDAAKVKDDEHLMASGLMVIFPFVMELVDALLPKLEVLYGIHAVESQDNAVRQQVFTLVEGILKSKLNLET